MILIVHEGDPSTCPRTSRPRANAIAPATMAAEGPLHELGAIQIVNSDSQGMGRIGETIRRTLQLADAMKRWRRATGAGWPGARTTTSGCCATSPRSRPSRAIVHGIAGRGRLAPPGRLADIVLWRPAHVRREARDGAQGRRRRVERDRRGQRQRARGRADALRARLGRRSATRRRALDHVRLRGRARRGLRRNDGAAAWSPVRGTRGLTRDALAWNTAAPSGSRDLARRRHRDAGRTRARLRADRHRADVAPLPA